MFVRRCAAGVTFIGRRPAIGIAMPTGRVVASVPGEGRVALAPATGRQGMVRWWGSRTLHSTGRLCGSQAVSGVKEKEKRPKRGANKGYKPAAESFHYAYYNYDKALTQVAEAFYRRHHDARVAYWEYNPFQYVVVFVDESFRDEPSGSKRRKRLLSFVNEALKDGELPHIAEWNGFDFDVRALTEDEIPPGEEAFFVERTVKKPEKLTADLGPAEARMARVDKKLAAGVAPADYDAAMRALFAAYGPTDGKSLSYDQWMAGEGRAAVAEGAEFEATPREFAVREAFSRGVLREETMDYAAFVRAYEWLFKQDRIETPERRYRLALLMLEAQLDGEPLLHTDVDLSNAGAEASTADTAQT